MGFNSGFKGLICSVHYEADSEFNLTHSFSIRLNMSWCVTKKCPFYLEQCH